ncbi:MAG TPA: phenylalanine--tRNA ligase subunit beta [Gemmatimonadales bacterium]|nr:phenylalanine--tRNA ligase subunit beta [Gemmatimonadales bacterium]
MNVSRRWLEAFLRQSLDAHDVSRRLAALGAAVDAVEPLHATLGDIVVALVEDVRPHPNADRLRVCTVNDGGPERRSVVCGAPNVTAGRKYPFAPIGATLPGGLRIEQRKLRGELSQGMLCSARELEVGSDADGLWDLGDVEAAPGTRLVDAVPLADDRLVVDVTPNRPDLLGHKGVARELAFSLGVAYRLPAIPGADAVEVPPFRKPAGERSAATGGVRIAIDDPDGCARFHAAVVQGVTVGPSPLWLRQRLEAVGVRSINNVVDATNYVMLELGQPMHAYDLATLEGPELVARRAVAGEKLVTLDGVERTLDDQMTVIADAGRVVGVAGVMGGRDTEVSERTTDLVLECAWFTPSRIRRTRRALGLSSEASYRFERGVDRWNGAEAMRRCIEIIVATAGGRVADAPVDVHPDATHPPRIFLRLARVAQVLGLPLAQHDVERALVAIGATVVAKPDDGRLAVDVPGWRPDLTAEIDLVEEVARVHGYDRLPDELRPFRVGALPDAPAVPVLRRLTDGLVAEGLCEVVSLPFGPAASDRSVGLLNPLADTGAYLRERLLPGLVAHVERNWNNQTRDVRLFEVGTVFERGAPGERPLERTRVAAVITGGREPFHWANPDAPDVDRWDGKGLAEAVAALAFPGTPWHVQGDAFEARDGDGRPVGWAGPLRADAPPWAAPLFGVEIDVALVAPERIVVRPLPTTPAATRDLSLVVEDGLGVARIAEVIRATAGDLLESARVTAEYRGASVGEGRRSVTFRLTCRAPDRTLRDQEVDELEQRVLGALATELGLARRGA